ncbi:hypothetical protein Ddye_002224 [Dipteronia dyeriana]|uniref:COBRA-like protein n=1 Tax=Dipteronia dyeriana TaxID=168575 RepID=A0AAD9XQP8_9ROSI|nr:hypothetical protein Ddye_002224 [Dipteronia dyeriana]
MDWKVLRDNSGKVLGMFSNHVGILDSNSVKLLVTHRVVTLCAETTIFVGKKIDIVSDSKMAVSWINSEGIGSLKHVKLIYHTRNLLNFLENTRVIFNPRDINSFADSRAKKRSDGYDPLDPHSNITIKWDLLQSNGATNDFTVSIFNFQNYRHIDEPGWRLSWAWQADEVIWSLWGAEATEQGNCSAFKATVPHCCEKRPVIIDLLPGTPYNQQTKNCCKGGVLTSMSQDPSKSFSTFQMNIGGVLNYTGFAMPVNFSLGVPGYTCGDPFEVPPSRFSPDKGRRWTQALSTWNVTCMYSQFLASQNPKCCVSLSAFYNNTITPCPKCSCQCQDDPTAKCIKDGETPSLLQQKHDPNEKPSQRVICSNHMCPIRVHWHVKQNYKEYWRVKMTVTNLNVMRNYSQWNMVVLHPNLQSIQQVFSFNYKPLSQYGYINDTGMLWGIQYFNDMLLQAGESGNAQTEILFHKDEGIFTLSDGWAFPRRIMFNGDECVMPPPDHYPTLPNTAASTPTFITLLFSFLFLKLVL